MSNMTYSISMDKQGANMIKLKGTPETKDLELEIYDTENCELAYISCNHELEVECSRQDLRKFAEDILKELDKLGS